jgi:uncharacterized membrane protein
MNYHAYLNKDKAFYPPHPSFAEQIFNPLSGILTTRFAATFVLVAGMGIALLVQNAIRSGDAALIRAAQMKLARRGLFLYAVGAAVQWIWPGTILFYYGAFFLIAAVICTWSNRSLIAVSVVSIAVSTGLTAWRGYRSFEGDFTRWLSPTPNSPRNLLIRTFFDYTHPVFPWITFICAGIILGRSLPLSRCWSPTSFAHSPCPIQLQREPTMCSSVCSPQTTTIIPCFMSLPLWLLHCSRSALFLSLPIPEKIIKQLRFFHALDK